MSPVRVIELSATRKSIRHCRRQGHGRGNHGPAGSWIHRTSRLQKKEEIGETAGMKGTCIRGLGGGTTEDGSRSAAAEAENSN